MKFSIKLIQSYISEPLPDPAELERIFTFHLCEVEGVEELPDGDVLLDLNILPNRAHDMLGHYGVARELCGQLGLTLKPLLPGSHHSSREGSGVGVVSVSIQTTKCLRYTALPINNVSVNPSDQNVIDELAKKGQRSINSLVDATNSTMFITGQPTHVFDADKITGGITVRMARVGEKIVLLGGQEVELDESTMIIADDAATLAIAGIKGGKHAEVDENTKNIILEVANFDASTIRKTAQRLGLRTDASYRFERDISPSVCDDGMNLLVGIIGVHGGAEQLVGVLTDVYPAPQTPVVIEFSLAEVVRVAGSQISNADVTNILQRYGFAYVEREDNFSVTVPLWRLDLTGRHDMIEEIIRVRGLEYVEPVAPPLLEVLENNLHQTIQSVRATLLSSGFDEVLTYSFVEKGESSVLASAGDKSYLRTNLADEMKKSALVNFRNRDILGSDVVAQFEIGTIFHDDSEEVHACVMLAYPVSGNYVKKLEIYLDEQKEKAFNLFSSWAIQSGKSKTDVTWVDYFRDGEKLEKTEWCVFAFIEVSLGDTVNPVDFQTLGPRSAISIVAEAPLKYAAGDDGKIAVTPFIEWSKYPYITRDIAVWVPESYDPNELESTYTTLGGELLLGAPRLVDHFTKEGRTSYAYRLVFQSNHRTLSDSDIAPIIETIYTKLAESGFEVR